MAVMRVEKNRNYTTMSNYHLRDTSLSLKAIGLLSKILSLPEEWDYTVAGLAEICKEGKDAIRSALEELEKAGYIERSQTHSADGTFSGNEYIVHEEPVGISPLSGFPSTVNPSTENPLTGNPTQLNTDISSKDLNNPPIVPQTGDAAPENDVPESGTPKRGGRQPKETTAWKPERFEAFWEYYGYKVGRQDAIRAWDRLKPSDALIDRMAKALQRQKLSWQWTKDGGIYRPHPATWINGRKWEDELGPPGMPRAAPEERKLDKWT